MSYVDVYTEAVVNVYNDSEVTIKVACVQTSPISFVARGKGTSA